ncbi:hypothetical protein D3C86_2233740 [compost metagenome]
MGQGQYLGRTEVRSMQALVARQAAFQQMRVEQAELLHGKTVLRREGRAVVVVVDQRQEHRSALGSVTAAV